MISPLLPLLALDVSPRARLSNYPLVYAARMAGRTKRQLGDAFGLTGFGVNMVELAPGARSSLLHRHSAQEEFVFVLAGHPTVRLDDAEHELGPGMCVGFLPTGPAHCLVNRTQSPVRYLEMGDRDASDNASYPEDDLLALRKGASWEFTHRDGTPW